MKCVLYYSHFTDEKKTSLEKNVYLAQDQAQEPEFQPRSPTPGHLGHLG